MDRLGLNEFLSLIKNAKSAEEIDVYQKQILDLIPSMAVMIGYDQRNHSHQYDLWNHCLHTVVNLPHDLDDDMLYLAAILHDIGKSDCQVAGKREGDTNMHYYGHPKRSMEIVRDEVIPHLCEIGEELSIEDQERLLYYVEYHDDHASTKHIKYMRKHLNMGKSLQEYQKLMLLQVADAKAHILIPIVQERIRICEQLAGDLGLEFFSRIMEDK